MDTVGDALLADPSEDHQISEVPATEPSNSSLPGNAAKRKNIERMRRLRELHNKRVISSSCWQSLYSVGGTVLE